MSVNVSFLIDLVTYVQNILQPSFVGPLDVVAPRHLPILPNSRESVSVFCVGIGFCFLVSFWPTVLLVEPLVQCVVCRLSSVTFCIVAKRYILAKNCLKE